MSGHDPWSDVGISFKFLISLGAQNLKTSNDLLVCKINEQFPDITLTTRIDLTKTRRNIFRVQLEKFLTLQFL